MVPAMFVHLGDAAQGLYPLAHAFDLTNKAAESILPLEVLEFDYVGWHFVALGKLLESLFDGHFFSARFDAFDGKWRRADKGFVKN